METIFNLIQAVVVVFVAYTLGTLGYALVMLGVALLLAPFWLAWQWIRRRRKPAATSR